MTDFHDAMWTEAARDVDFETRTRTLTLAKVATAEGVWPFLAGAGSEAEFRARLDVCSSRIEQTVAAVSSAPEVLDQVLASLREDYALLAASRRVLPSSAVKTLAGAWADGDPTHPLTALAMTGRSGPAVLAEIDALLARAGQAEAKELTALRAWAAWAGEQGPQLGWSALAVTALGELPIARELEVLAPELAGVDPHGLLPELADGGTSVPPGPPITPPGPGPNPGPSDGPPPPDAGAGPSAPMPGAGPAGAGGGDDGSADDGAGDDSFEQGYSDGLAGGQPDQTFVGDPDYADGFQQAQEHLDESKAGADPSPPGPMASRRTADVVWNPEDAAFQYPHPEAYTAGHSDGRNRDNAGEEFARDPETAESYHAGLADGQEATQVESSDPSYYGTDPDAGWHDRTSAAVGLDPEYKGHYQRGWNSSRNYTGGGASSPLERADMRGEPDAWYDGYHDYAADREKWHTPRNKSARRAVNEDKAGSERYQHTPSPAVPAWITDQFTGNTSPIDQDWPEGKIVNDADGHELDATAPWLVKEMDTTGRRNASTGEHVLTIRSPRPLVVSTTTSAINGQPGNQFAYQGPGMTPAPMPGQPLGDPSGAMMAGDPAGTMAPGASTDPTDGTMPAPPAAAPVTPVVTGTDPALGNPYDPTADADMPDGDTVQRMPTSARYLTGPAGAVDRIAASVLSMNPGLTLSQCLGLAQRTVARHPELARR